MRLTVGYPAPDYTVTISISPSSNVSPAGAERLLSGRGTPVPLLFHAGGSTTHSGSSNSPITVMSHT